MVKKIKDRLFPADIAQYRLDFSRENSRALRYLLLCGFFVCLFVLIFQLLSPVKLPITLRLPEYLLFFLGSAGIYIVNWRDVEKNGTLLLYIWVMVLLSFSIFLTAGDDSNYPTFLFIFFITFLPLLIHDAWGKILILTLGFSLIFLIVDCVTRPAEIFVIDLFHLIPCVAGTLFLTSRGIGERVHFIRTSTYAETEAERDGLTGIYNRRGGEQTIRKLIANGTTGAFVIIDVDDFKRVNDYYSHATGDEILKQVANCLKSSFRDSDVVMRMGGDEFIVYAVGMADIHHVEGKLAQVKEALHEIILDENTGDYMTVSMGCIVNLGSYPGYDELSGEADKLLYLVKAAGKDNYKCSDRDYTPPVKKHEETN